MDGWLKALSAVACLVGIVACGVYLWTAYSAHQKQADTLAQRDMVRAELYDLAGAKDGDSGRVVTFCQALRDRPDAFSDKEMAQQVVRNCRALGFI